MTFGRKGRVGLSLLPLGNRGGTGFYTERLLEVLLAHRERSFELVPILPRRLKRQWEADGIPFRPVGTLSLRWPFVAGSRFWGGSLAEGVDLLHYPNGVGPPNPGIPVIATVHDVAPFFLPDAFPFSRAVFLKRALSASVRYASRVVTDTQWQAERILEIFPQARGRIRVVFPTIDPVFSDKTVSEDFAVWIPSASFVLMVGTLEPRKNVLLGLEAWARSGIEADLILAGRWGWKTRALKSALRSIGAPSGGKIEAWRLNDGRKVVRLGFVPKRKLAVLYRKALCLLYPSRFEGFGLPVLEAMACGCPVVIPSKSAMEEVAGKAGWYFDPGCVESVRGVLEEVRVSDRERAARADVGAARARLFDAENLFREIEKVYLEVL